MLGAWSFCGRIESQKTTNPQKGINMSEDKILDLLSALDAAIKILNSIDKPIENAEEATLFQKMAQQISEDLETKIPPKRKVIIEWSN